MLSRENHSLEYCDKLKLTMQMYVILAYRQWLVLWM